jgi:hypothetical protein
MRVLLEDAPPLLSGSPAVVNADDIIYPDDH